MVLNETAASRWYLHAYMLSVCGYSFRGSFCYRWVSRHWVSGCLTMTFVSSWQSSTPCHSSFSMPGQHHSPRTRLPLVCIINIYWTVRFVDRAEVW